MGVHVEGVNAEVVRRQLQALKNLFQRQILAVPVYHSVLEIKIVSFPNKEKN